MKKLFLATVLTLSTISAQAEVLASGHQFSSGSFWELIGRNPDSHNCRYLQIVYNPRECKETVSAQGYTEYKISDAKYRYQSFSHGSFGSSKVIACFGCM